MIIFNFVVLKQNFYYLCILKLSCYGRDYKKILR